ncbi:MAG TPA: 16S rRNA (cytosine(1402)-N(4))-methyltransferase [Peptococcaceae bacterium]|nr:MAG: SAM-dependent methyltransferase, MraW methylase family [Clostridia bacterium 41_269]HBT20455.1 16S rRNA (cytosine(1402)-N(4))-methyltransferase [Peptococcaceae bacterium]
MDRLFKNAVELSHKIVSCAVEEGDTVVDATAGNGWDTVFLAELVSERGKVYSFDIQEQALKNTEQKLKERNLIQRVRLIKDGHENMKEYISEEVKAVMFNLGYLPGYDHTCITRPSTTVKALASALSLLKKGGLISIVIYTGHEGGIEESRAVLEFISQLPQNEWDVVTINFPNRKNYSPYLAAVQKR